jgi:putative FmdB family regulatory protein
MPAVRAASSNPRILSLPTYQYRCTECGHAFEQFQSFTDDALTVCPRCAGKLRKVYNAVGVVFKGSGFYRNDSRATGSSTETPAATTGDSSGSSSTTTSAPDTAASAPASAPSGPSSSTSTSASAGTGSTGD